ncbi:MAG: hypothetical protein LAKADJCE_00559 [Candidatus Argoarchaeum ethanivorans]|uniref:DUF8076 domain-containing protein n=1 Tax=Candidatus Argoarchaeum ethanivorans TaxID=2608793 RepID=A0A811TD72_9EURY|nr:MAG: hypothetical protein LAKADJCE_00559 [Candidatus Argoarchaeum ethanivorans]
MRLKHGFNIVENEYDRFENIMTLLEFLGDIRRNKQIPSRVTVKGLDTLLLNSCDQEEMGMFIGELLRDGQSKGLIRTSTVVQFIVDGKITKDIHTKIKVRNEYINLENWLAPDWVHAVR